MKTIYLVRHGETHFNRGWRHQHPSVELTPRGFKQAARLGEYAKSLNLDVILTSDFVRAEQTAGVIADMTAVKKESSQEFRELMRPSQVWGKHYVSPHSLYAMFMILLHSGNPQWRYSDEESVAMFESRIKSAMHTLAHRTEETVMVVTHRVFISGFLALIKNNQLDDEIHFARALTRALAVDNCSVTTVTYDEKERRWGIVEVNHTQY